MHILVFTSYVFISYSSLLFLFSSLSLFFFSLSLSLSLAFSVLFFSANINSLLRLAAAATKNHETRQFRAKWGSIVKSCRKNVFVVLQWPFRMKWGSIVKDYLLIFPPFFLRSCLLHTASLLHFLSFQTHFLQHCFLIVRVHIHLSNCVRLRSRAIGV